MLTDNPIYKLFGALTRFGLTLETSAVVLTELIYWGAYGLVKLFINPSFSFFNKYNYLIFTLRDQALIVLLLPLVMRYVKKIEDFSSEILKNIHINNKVANDLSRDFYRKLYHPLGNLLIGILLSMIYGALNIKYMLTGLRSHDFAIFRFIVLYALLGISCFIYQQIILVNFAYNIFSLYQFKEEAYIKEVKRFQEIVLLGSFLSILLSFTLLLTPLIIGFYLTSLLWYISFHGFLSTLSLYLFLKAMRGLHESHKINTGAIAMLPPIDKLKNKSLKTQVLRDENKLDYSIIFSPNMNMRNYFVFLLVSIFLIFLLMVVRYLW